MPTLGGKTALITGASTLNGIGRACAKRLATDGANVVVTDMPGPNEDGTDRMTLLEDLAAEINRNGGSALALPLDVTDAQHIAHATEAAIKSFGAIDVLVNNAGTLAGTGPFMATTADQWDLSFRINVLGPMLLCQAVIPSMQKNGWGRIINIGSISSLAAREGFGAYTASKHGLLGMTKTLAAEFGKDGILCNLVAPGYIATDMHTAANERIAAARGVDVDQIKSERYDAVAVRDAGQPDDVANTVAFLAGPGSAYITGVALPVTGGLPMGI